MSPAKDKPEGMSKEGREMWWKLVEDCTLNNPNDRPVMSGVITRLNIILDVVQGTLIIYFFCSHLFYFLNCVGKIPHAPKEIVKEAEGKFNTFLYDFSYLILILTQKSILNLFWKGEKGQIILFKCLMWIFLLVN